MYLDMPNSRIRGSLTSRQLPAPLIKQSSAVASEMPTSEKQQGALVQIRQCITPPAQGTQHLRGGLVLSQPEGSHWKQRFTGGNEVPVHPEKALDLMAPHFRA